MIDKIFNENCFIGMKRLPDNSVDLICTDPPYNVTRNEWDSAIDLAAMWKEFERVAKATAAIVINCQQPFTTDLISSNRKNFRYCWTWYKKQCSGFLNANRQPLRNVEDIAVFYRRQCTFNPQKRKGKPALKSTGGGSTNYNKFECKPHVSEDYFPTLLLEIPLPRFKNGHPTQKPVELVEYLIKTYTAEGDIVLDCFMGSGTTAEACIRTNRHFIGFELDEKYYEIADKRIEKARQALF